MARLTIYLDDELKAKVSAAAKAVNLSKSRWVAQVIRNELEREWPQSVMALAGAWEDIPLAEEIRAAGGLDVDRELV